MHFNYYYYSTKYINPRALYLEDLPLALMIFKALSCLSKCLHGTDFKHHYKFLEEKATDFTAA